MATALIGEGFEYTDIVERGGFQAIKYTLVNDEGTPVLFAIFHGTPDGKMWDDSRTHEISESEVNKIASVMISVMAQKYGLSKDQIVFACTCCYPSAVKAKTNLPIVGDWNQKTGVGEYMPGVFGIYPI